MSRPKSADAATTTVGLFRFLAREPVPSYVVAGAVVPAVRLAWERGGGAALASVRLAPRFDGYGRRRLLGADLCEAVLDALDRWCDGERMPVAEAVRLLQDANHVDEAGTEIFLSIDDRGVRVPGSLTLLRYLAKREALDRQANDPDAAWDMNATAAWAIARATYFAALAAWPYEPGRRSGYDEVLRYALTAAETSAVALYAAGEREMLGRRSAAEAMVLEVVREGLKGRRAERWPGGEAVLRRAMELVGLPKT